MNRWMYGGLALLLLGVVAAGARHFSAETDPLVERVEERIRALRPDVEAALGAEIPGSIEVLIMSREELDAFQRRAHRRLTRTIDGEPRCPPADLEGDASFFPSATLACVDGRGRIRIARDVLEPVPIDRGVLGEFLELRPQDSEPADSKTLDLTLIYELVHVYQVRELGLMPFRRGARHRSDLLARRAVSEGHAEHITRRIAVRRGLDAEFDLMRRLDEDDARLDECYAWFELGAVGRALVFPYLEGKSFVDSVSERFGAAALSRMFAEPPTLAQIDAPSSWPDLAAAPAGTDHMLARMRRWMRREWKNVECDPFPASGYLSLLEVGGPEVVARARDALIESQRFEAKGDPYWHAMRGHLLAARDEAGAQVLLDTWVHAARARDALVPSNPRLVDEGVRESDWTVADIDGRVAHLATRTYRRNAISSECAVAVRSGRYVLEVRLIDDPGAARAAVRMARRLLAFVDEHEKATGPDSPRWSGRFLHAIETEDDIDAVRVALGDGDPDVRYASVVALSRQGELGDDERKRARSDDDALVRLAAATAPVAGDESDWDALMAAMDDGDDWVAGGACQAVNRRSGRVSSDRVAAALERPSLALRRAAARLLDAWGDDGANGDESRMDVVRRALDDADAGVRLHAAEALLLAPADVAGLEETYAKVLRDEEDRVARTVLSHFSVRDYEVPIPVDALMDVLSREALAEWAVEALGNLGDSASTALPHLRRIANGDGEATLRLQAHLAVWRLSGAADEFHDYALGLLADGSDENRWELSRVLPEFGEGAAALVSPVTDELGSDDPDRVWRSLSTLRQLGAVARPAIPAIREIKSHADRHLAEAARKTLRAIRRDARRR